MADYQSTPVVNTPEILYRLKGVNGELLYVGITRDWPTRMKQHQADKPWWTLVRHTEFVYVDGTRQQIEAIERAVIKTEAPIYNKTHNMPAPPPLDERTRNQRDADRVNATLLSQGYPPFVWIDRDDNKRSFAHVLRGGLRNMAVEKMARLWCDMHDADDTYRCASTHEHECTATARDVERGTHCPLPEELSFT